MNLSPQQQKGLLTDRNLVVSAGAGAGKTSVLTSRFLKLLDEGIDPKEILAITFTKKAAEEMRFRINEEIHSKIKTVASFEKSEKEKTYLFSLMIEISKSSIVTFDALFQSIYHEFGPLFGLSPQVSIIENQDKSALVLQIESALNKKLSAIESEQNPDFKFGGISISEIRKSVKYLYLLDKYFETMTSIKNLVTKSHDVSDLNYLNAQTSLGLNGCIQLTAFYDFIFDENSSGKFAEIKSKLNDFLEAIRIKYQITITPLLTDDKKEIAKKIKIILTELELYLLKNGISVFPEFNEVISSILVERNVTEIQKKSGELRFHTSQIAKSFITEYQTLKESQNLADYHDFQNQVSWLIQHHQLVRNSLSTRFKHVLIDEFQDTNFSQWEIIKPFVWDEYRNCIQPGKLFIVGDAKQSIYRFRNAQVEVFKFISEQVIKSNQFHQSKTKIELTGNENYGEINLTQNFRACGSLLKFVNTLFSEEFSKDYTNNQLQNQVDYSDMEFAKIFDKEKETSGFVKIIDAPKREISSAICEQVIELLHKFKNSEEQFDLNRDKIAVIASKNDLLKSVSAALKQLSVPHNVYGTGNLLQNQEGLDCLNFIRFLAEPESDVNAIGLMKSPFFLIADDVFLWLKSSIPNDNLFSIVQQLNIDEMEIEDHEKTKLKLFKTFSELWLRQIKNKSLTSILWSALNETGAWSLYQAQFNSDQIIKNINTILDYLFKFEEREPRSVLDFVHFLENMSLEDYGIEENTGSANGDFPTIDLLTVHKAKGLTYKFVLVIDSFEMKNQGNADSFIIDYDYGMSFKGWHDLKWNSTVFYDELKQKQRKDAEAERIRQVYVALTRATHGFYYIADFSKVESKNSKTWSWAKRIHRLLDEFRKIENFSFITFTSSTQKREIPNWDFKPEIISNDNDISFQSYIDSLKPKANLPDSYFTNFTATGMMAANQCGTANRLKKISVYKSDLKDKPVIPSALKGTIIHELMACHLDQEKEKLVWQKYQTISEEVKTEIKTTVSGMWKNQVILRLSEKKSYHELNFLAKIKNRFVQGSMDWLILDNETATILDFKSNRITRGGLEKLFSQYELQFKLYAFSTAQIFPDISNFKLNIFSTHLNESFEKSFSRKEVLNFENELIAIIELIENREFDRSFKELDQYKCEDCAFHQYCYAVSE